MTTPTSKDRNASGRYRRCSLTRTFNGTTDEGNRATMAHASGRTALGKRPHPMRRTTTHAADANSRPEAITGTEKSDVDSLNWCSTLSCTGDASRKP